MLYLNEEKNEEWVKALVYGKSGTGKTTLGCTAPKPVFLLSERQGWDSIRKASRALRIPTPPTFLLQTSKDLNDAVRALNSARPMETLVKILVWNEEERTAAAEQRKPDKDKAARTAEKMIAALPYLDPLTIVPDSITDMFRLESDAIDEISPPKVGKDGLPVKAERYWSALRERCERLVRRFRDLPFHVLYLALLDDRTVGEDDQKTRQVGPDAPMRALPGAIMQCTNMVGIMSVNVKLQAPTKENREPQAMIRHWVRFTGPDWMMTKPNRPLRDVEVPNFSAWIHTLKTVDPATVLDLGQGVPTESELSFDKESPPATPESDEPDQPAEESETEEVAPADPEPADPVPTAPVDPEPAPTPAHVPPGDAPSAEAPAPDATPPEQPSTPPAEPTPKEPTPKPKDSPQVSLKKLGESMKTEIVRCTNQNELAAVWVNHVDQIEALREKAPKAIARLEEITRDRCTEIIRAAAEKYGDDLGVTAQDLLDRVLHEYQGRTQGSR